jgi:hypothetical protein
MDIPLGGTCATQGGSLLCKEVYMRQAFSRPPPDCPFIEIGNSLRYWQACVGGPAAEGSFIGDPRVRQAQLPIEMFPNVSVKV